MSFTKVTFEFEIPSILIENYLECAKNVVRQINEKHGISIPEPKSIEEVGGLIRLDGNIKENMFFSGVSIIYAQRIVDYKTEMQVRENEKAIRN